MQTVTISQEHYTDLQMNIAHLLKQVAELKQQLSNSLEIGSRLASNLQQERDKNETLREKQPHYIATITIDSWHCDGSHFPAYVGTAHGTSLQEAFDHAILLHLKGHYRLTDVPKRIVPCCNFLYANGREVNIIITEIS